MVSFAVDVALVTRAKHEEILTSMINRGLLRISSEFVLLRANLAPEETESVMITEKVTPICLELLGMTFGFRKSLKYLGFWLNSKLECAEHINQAIVKTEKTIKALSNFMLNIGGPRASKRKKILSSIAHPQIL